MRKNRAYETVGRDGGDVETEYPDWGPYTICQYNARRATMAMNVTNVVVPGNSQLKAGNKSNCTSSLLNLITPRMMTMKISAEAVPILSLG